jgi:hypothetical protein
VPPADVLHPSVVFRKKRSGRSDEEFVDDHGDSLSSLSLSLDARNQVCFCILVLWPVLNLNIGSTSLL